VENSDEKEDKNKDRSKIKDEIRLWEYIKQ
jgi:hypothetical protein